MEKLFTTRFKLKKENIELTDVINNVSDWLASKSQTFSPQDLAGITQDNFSISRNNVHIKSILINNGDEKHFALEFLYNGIRDLDFFRTRIALHENQGKIDFSCRLDYGQDSKGISPKTVRLTKPEIVNRLIHEYGAKDDSFSLLINPTPVNLSQINLELFPKYLMGEIRRYHPIVYVSKKFDAEKGEFIHLIDLQVLSSKLSGLANVIYEETPQFSRELAKKNLIPIQLLCYGGAVRVYWQNPNEMPYNNYIWSPQYINQVKEKENEVKERRKENGQNYKALSFVEQEIFQYIVEVLNRRLIPDELTFDGVSRLQLRQKSSFLRESLIARSTSEEKTIGNLESQLSLWKELAQSYSDENEVFQVNLDELKSNYENKKSKIQVLESRIVNLESKLACCETGENFIPDVDSMRDLIIIGLAKYGENLIIPKSILNGKEVRKSDGYKNPADIINAMKWLSFQYLLNLNFGGDLANHLQQNISLKEFCGGRGTYAPHQSETTLNMFGNGYEVVHDGNKYKILEHIKFGSDKDPQNTFRIGFGPVLNAKTQEYNKVIIGYLGPHQKNRSSK